MDCRVSHKGRSWAAWFLVTARSVESRRMVPRRSWVSRGKVDEEELLDWVAAVVPQAVRAASRLRRVKR